MTSTGVQVVQFAVGLPGYRLEDLAVMAEGDAMSGIEGPRFEQWIFHSRSLLLHGCEGLADHRRAHFSRTQVANFFDLQEVKEGIALRRGYQFGLLPRCQLTGRDP